jgi:hypothetical protein
MVSRPRDIVAQLLHPQHALVRLLLVEDERATARIEVASSPAGMRGG